MNTIADRVIIGYGSESGNARSLAERLGAEPALQSLVLDVRALNDIRHEDLDKRDLLVIISSSFGDGDPPPNAEDFMTRLQRTGDLSHLRYAIFGLGDTAYPRFCGFTKALDAALKERGATEAITRVDADTNFAAFFDPWKQVLLKVLSGEVQAGRELRLQVVAYDDKAAFNAPVLERRQLNRDTPGAWHIRMNIAGSGMAYRAGDTLYVIAENDPDLLNAIAGWYGDPAVADLLRDRELRQIGKSVLRELARLSGNEHLRDMLRISRKKDLADYLPGADLLDILVDFCTPHAVPPAALAEVLPACLPRAYSIASAGGDELDLCVREVIYQRGDRLRHGTATRCLIGDASHIRVYCRSNPNFHLPDDSSAPMILIGTGTGIAPLMGLLRETRSGRRRNTCLVFGEKTSERDFLYRDELSRLSEDGILTHLLPAFSRDGPVKYYVQDAIAGHAGQMRNLLDQGAHVYVCGNKQHLEQAVTQALDGIREGACAEMLRTGRLHRELY
ncbi:flavodoxin domain-containing protein [Paenirhodobacter sp.]|uniref:flavodoxin domain-containing protein n=1 Tax=Paenirhodobacter sp. TaxID=1965326 RepID=UPI003B3ECFA1